MFCMTLLFGLRCIFSERTGKKNIDFNPVFFLKIRLIKHYINLHMTDMTKNQLIDQF